LCHDEIIETPFIERMRGFVFRAIKVKPLSTDIFQYIAAALLIGLIVALAKYVLAFSKEERDRRRNAKLEFCAILETDLGSILKSNDDARNALLNKEIIYQDAMKAFRKHLLFWQLHSFDKAWAVFFYHPANKNMPYLEQYMDFGSLTKRKACHALLSSRINTLLKYAKVRP
jgi:hypothetical protein